MQTSIKPIQIKIFLGNEAVFFNVLKTTFTISFFANSKQIPHVNPPILLLFMSYMLAEFSHFNPHQ